MQHSGVFVCTCTDEIHIRVLAARISLGLFLQKCSLRVAYHYPRKPVHVIKPGLRVLMGLHVACRALRSNCLGLLLDKHGPPR